jgi:thiamine-phosphate pyrophosphorylase
VSEVPGRLAAARLHGLHVLADDDPRWGGDPIAQARAACAGGAAVVQLRAKFATDREMLGWAQALRELTLRAGSLFFVNDRFDLALAAQADGVHLGQQDLPPARIPPWLRERLIVGRSTHTLEEARAASAEPVDYVAFGPVFGTTSKDSPHAARGLALLRGAATAVAPLPLVAIGGIHSGNAAGAIGAGAAAIAVISAVAGAPDPEAATRALVRALAEASPS